MVVIDSILDSVHCVNNIQPFNIANSYIFIGQTTTFGPYVKSITMTYIPVRNFFLSLTSDYGKSYNRSSGHNSSNERADGS